MDKPSNADRIAAELRARSLAVDEDVFIGTEDSLAASFGVSAPTLRKAIRQLEHEEVIKVKRGLHGGFFSHRPTMQTVVRIAGIFLGAHTRSIDDAPQLVEALTPILIDGVLNSGRMAEFECFSTPQPDPLPHDQFIDQVYRFSNLLYASCGNLPLQLVIRIFFHVGLSVVIEEQSGDTEGQVAHQQLQARLARSLLAGDRTDAISSFVGLSNMVFGGMKQSLERQRTARANSHAR